MRYFSHDAAVCAAERAELLPPSPRGPTPSSTASAPAFDIDDDRVLLGHWRKAVHGTWWYRVSSLTYCVAGSPVVFKPEIISRYGRHACCRAAWPFRLMGLCIIANGLVSYMGDVVTWGRPSVWKSIDVAMATTNTLIQLAIVGAQCAGWLRMPVLPCVVLAIGIVAALVCKRCATDDGNPARMRACKRDCTACAQARRARRRQRRLRRIPALACRMAPLPALRRAPSYPPPTNSPTRRLTCPPPPCAGALIGQLMLVAIDDGGRSDLFLCLSRAGCVGGVRGVYDVDHDIG